ncbi:MAG: alpha/beta fold hydrolase [Verrucomicrobiota bacterium]
MMEDHWIRVGPENRRLRVGIRRGVGCDPSPVLVLLHGVTRCGRDWEPIVPHLDPRWEIHAIDHRGHGDSDRAEGYRVLDYARDLADWLQRGTGAPVVLMGHSLGAMAAAWAAAKVPGAVRALLLEDPPFVAMGEVIVGTTWQALFEGMREVCRRGGTLKEHIDRLGDIQVPRPDGFQVSLRTLRSPEALAWGAQCLSKLDPSVLDPLIGGRWMEGIDWAGIACALHCPVVLLQGDIAVGGALADADAEAFLGRCRRGERIRFEGQGHQLHGTIPETIAKTVDCFLG